MKGIFNCSSNLLTLLIGTLGPKSQSMYQHIGTPLEFKHGSFKWVPQISNTQCMSYLSTFTKKSTIRIGFSRRYLDDISSVWVPGSEDMFYRSPKLTKMSIDETIIGNFTWIPSTVCYIFLERVSSSATWNSLTNSCCLNHCTCGVPFRINFKTMAPLGCVIVACQRRFFSIGQRYRTRWSTLTLLLICSPFSRENGHLLLICSSLSPDIYIYTSIYIYIHK